MCTFTSRQLLAIPQVTHNNHCYCNKHAGQGNTYSRICVQTIASHTHRPFRVFQCMQGKSERPGQFGNAMMTYLPPFLPRFTEMMADTSSFTSPNRPGLTDFSRVR